jgi:hypothetical protein
LAQQSPYVLRVLIDQRTYAMPDSQNPPSNNYSVQSVTEFSRFAASLHPSAGTPISSDKRTPQPATIGSRTAHYFEYRET